MFIEFIVKHKIRFFGGYSKQILKNILRDLRAIQICKQDPNLCMASLDIDSIFISIPLNKTIFDIFIDNLYKDDENTPKIPWVFFRNLLNLATKE